MKSSSLLAALILVISSHGFAQSLRPGESVSLSISSLKAPWSNYAIRPVINRAGQLRLLAVQSGVFKVMDKSGRVLSEIKVPACSDPKILVHDKSFRAAMVCELNARSVTFINLNNLATSNIMLPARWTTKNGAEYLNAAGAVSITKAVNEEIGEGTLVTQAVLRNVNNPKDEITQFRTYSIAQAREVSRVEIRGNAISNLRDFKNAARFFNVGPDLHMIFISRVYNFRNSYGPSSPKGDRDVVVTFNLSKGLVVSKIETTKNLNQVNTDCLANTDLVSMNGKTLLIAKSNRASQPSCMPESLKIPWRDFKMRHIQIALINPLTFKSEKVIESQILRGWELRPFHLDLNTHLDSVTILNGKPALRSSYQDMAKEDNTAVYIDLTDGTQSVGPYGDGSVQLGTDTISIGYEVRRESQNPFQQLIVNSLNKNGTELLKVEVPRCNISLCETDPDQFNPYRGGSVVTKGQLLFTVINRDRDELTVVRLK